MKMLLLLLVASPLASSSSACCGSLYPFLDASNASAAQLHSMLVCVDNHAACASWAAAGECTKNAGFMRAECRVSCNNCALAGEDAAAAAEVGLIATRNLALACHYASSQAAAVCADSTAAIPQLRSGRLSEVELRAIATGITHKVGAVCNADNRLHCPLGDEPHRVPVALQPQPPPRAAHSRPSLHGVLLLPHTYKLPHNVEMPKLGLGTWLTTGAECTAMVAAALRVGWRHIDTSENYMNHEAIGAALKQSGVPRGELFLADKISLPTSYSAQGVRAWVSTSLAALGTDYLDLLMLHSIGPNPTARIEAWRELEKLRDEGVVRAIGTSNFGTHEMAALRRVAREPPATHQIKFNPYHPGRTGNAAGEDFAADCAAAGCVVVAYCPLNAWPSKLAPIHDRWVAHVAAKYGRTPAQVLLRWVIQTGGAALTRSRSEARLREALGALEFELSEPDVKLLSGLAWHVESASHRPPAAVADVFGVAGLLGGDGAGGAGEDRVEL